MAATVKKTFDIALDIAASSSNRAFTVVEGDTGNVLRIALTDDGEPVDLTGCRVIAVFSKSNGTAAQCADQQRQCRSHRARRLCLSGTELLADLLQRRAGKLGKDVIGEAGHGDSIKGEMDHSTPAIVTGFPGPRRYPR